MKKRNWLIVTLAVLGLCGFAAASHAQQVLRLGSIVAAASVQAQAMDRFADNVKKKVTTQPLEATGDNLHQCKPHQA